MHERCPQGRFVAVGTISGWRFRINTRGVATVVAEDGATVYGVVWSLSKSDEQKLDRYEGVRQGVYSKRMVEVRLCDGSNREAFLYVAEATEPDVAKPGYIERIMVAAQSHNFPTWYIEEIQQWLTTKD